MKSVITVARIAPSIVNSKITIRFGHQATIGMLPVGSGQASSVMRVSHVANARPTARLAFSCTGLVCSLDASGSSDPDGAIAAYRWDFGDGTFSTSPNATKVYATPGTRDVTLTLTDNRAGVATEVRAITVANSNVAPTASFTGS